MIPTPSDSSSELKAEIGHVLFIDIVGYSKLLINEQSDLLEHLKGMVRGSEQVRAAEAEGKLIRLATGDGMALVFRNSPEAPAQCALELARADQEHPELQLRMGIHSGPINEVIDVNERANVTGAGINMAQRVMDCGDAGHILVSQRVAEDLRSYRQWSSRLHDLGECEVKHGVRLHLFNLYTDSLGNSALPAKFKAAAVGVTKASRKHAAFAVTLATALLIGAVVFWFLRKSGPTMLVPERPSVTAPAAIPEKSIAVLPFENLSDDKSNAYFAEGIQDEILTKLAGLADLKVISRTSTAKYQSKPDDLKTVSQQLGVANVVEGTVQKAADKVRVNVQLIDARADSHLWAKSYDGEAKDVFAIESEVSQGIADALQAKLSPNETSTLAAAPTKDPEAYDFFLKGEYAAREAERSRKAEAYDQAADWYQKAIDRDPNFALAIARMAENRIQRHWIIERLGDAELEKIRETAEHAMALAPNLAEAHIALGMYYYFGKRDYDHALRQFGRALELQPNNVRALFFSGAVHRRQGQWERSLSEMEKCEELDPRDATVPEEIGATYVLLRMWKEAKQAGLRSLALDPQNVDGMRAALLSCLNGTGDVKEATRILGTFPPDNTFATASWSLQEIIGLRVSVYLAKRDFGAALQAWDKESSDPTANRQRLSARAAIHVLAGDAAGAREEIETARGLVEAQLRERPDDKNALIQLSWINVALNHEAEALELAQRSAELLPPEKDSFGGSVALTGLAEIEARTGHANEAIKHLQRLLSIPAGWSVSIERLKIDPVWEPIRNDPGFQQLLAGKELIGPPK